MAAIGLHAGKFWEFLFFDLIENHKLNFHNGYEKKKSQGKISIDLF